jgi:hypothetical protein
MRKVVLLALFWTLSAGALAGCSSSDPVAPNSDARRTNWCELRNADDITPLQILTSKPQKAQVDGVDRFVKNFEQLASLDPSVPENVRSNYGELALVVSRIRDRITAGELLASFSASDADFASLNEIAGKIESNSVGLCPESQGSSVPLPGQIGFTPVQTSTTTSVP